MLGIARWLNQQFFPYAEHIEALGQQQTIVSPRRSPNVSPALSCNSNESHPDEDSAFASNDKVSFPHLCCGTTLLYCWLQVLHDGFDSRH